MVIIGLVGQICSGKDTFCKILQEQFNFKIIKLPDDEPSQNTIIENILNAWTTPTVIYPLTNKSQYDALIKRSYFFVISIEAPLLVRYKRYLAKSNTSIDLETFLKLDEDKQFNQNLYVVSNYAKVKVPNKGSSIQSLQTYITCKKSHNMKEHQDKIDRDFRPDLQIYFMKIAHVLKTRSNCMKKSVGAVLVDDTRRILSTSYIGTPNRLKNCNEGGCQVCNTDKTMNLVLENCQCIHAESGCILEAGIALCKGASLYSTLFPCVWCCKALVQAGIAWIYYDEQGDWDLALLFLGDLIRLKQIKLSDYIF